MTLCYRQKKINSFDAKHCFVVSCKYFTCKEKSLGFESRRDFSSTFILDISYSFNPGLHRNFENVQRNLINDIFLNHIRTTPKFH